MAEQTVRDKIMDVVAVVAVLCLVILVTRTLAGRGSPPAPGLGPGAALTTTPVDNWTEITSGGREMGLPSAPVTVAVFIDFECPACREFVLGPERRVRQEFPGDLRFVIRHMPLSYHRFADPAARAAECAAAQGRFEDMYGLLFEKQDSLGLISFERLAEESGVGDLGLFNECVSSDGVAARISADLDLAGRSGATATPTVLVNGLLLSRPPAYDELVGLVEEHLGEAR